MTSLFPVPLVHSLNEIVPANAQIVFHGVNKSGSFAMASAMRDAYQAAGRQKEFHCHYLVGGSTESFRKQIEDSTGPGFFVGHALYGALPAKPNRILITQFRHPLPRVLSCYNWLKNKHQASQPSSPYPSLDDWVANTKGKSHSQIKQFGVGNGTFSKSRQMSMTAEQIFEICVDAIDREVLCFGIAEYFEESLFMFAALSRLPAVKPWIRDKRNPGRPLSSEISEPSRSLIERVYKWDFKLYEYCLEVFKKRIREYDFGEALDEYKAHCADQYNDRILI